MFIKFVVAAVFLMLLNCSSQNVQAQNSHHTQNGFINPGNDIKQNTFYDFLKWKWEQLWKDIPGPDGYHFELAKTDPQLLKTVAGNTLTWIGHATVLLKMDGKFILTDPQFSERASPVQWAGPKRVVPPGLKLNALPTIDAVVISHDHYDSLDTDSIMALHNRRGGENTVFFVPLGLKAWFESLGIEHVVEMDWWDSQGFNGLKFTAVPMQHWSKRSMFATNKTLWAGWVIKSAGLNFLFVGDSGYGKHFKEIGEKLGPFDLAAIPIGAYEPRWFMSGHHIDPAEAVRVHQDIRAKKSVAIHWGTFILTDEPLTEPPQLLKQAKAEQGLSDDEFLVLKHGETIRLGTSAMENPQLK